MATCKFEIGDMVRRINHHNYSDGWVFKTGEVGKMVDIDVDGFCDVEVNGRVNLGNDPINLVLVSNAAKYKVGDHVVIEESNVDGLCGEIYAGQIGVVKDYKDTWSGHNYLINVDNRHALSIWCKVKCLVEEKKEEKVEPKCKFKIGDKVKVVAPAHKFKERFCGSVFTIDRFNPNGKNTFNEPHYGVSDFCPYVWQESELELVEEKHEEKIVITHDGKTTTATKYCEDGSKVIAIARCAPEDEFDFNVGATLAMVRLMEKVKSEEKKLNTKFNDGDYAKVVARKHGHRFEIGTIVKLKKGNFDYLATADNGEHWWVLDNELEACEPPKKYYNGKVVCVDNGNIPGDLTVGKVYTFEDGNCDNDRGGKILSKPCKDIDDLNSRWWSNVKFIPLVE